MKNIAYFLSLVSLASVSACGGSSSRSTPPDAAGVDVATPASLDTALPGLDAQTVASPDTTPVVSTCGYVATLCTKLATCAPFFLAAGYGDLAGCQDRLTKVCTEQSKSVGSGLNQTTMLACAAALDLASCQEILANTVTACTFHGSLADGAACGDNTQCASGFCSHGGSLCGVCAARGSVGAACPSGSNDECQPGLVCSPGNLCAVPAALGATCDDNTAPCLMGSFCTTAKTCAVTVAAGQECPGAYLNILDGTLCLGKSSPAKPVLAGQIGTAGVGQACGLTPGNDLPATLCAPGSIPGCTPTAGSGELLGIPLKGICAAPIEDGFTCITSSACLAGAQCISGTCRIPSGRYCEEPVDAG